MKASIYTEYGDASRLSVQDIPRPQPAKGEILVKVYVATANRSDSAMLTGQPWIMHLTAGLFKPRKQTLGTDFAGIVESIGEGVTAFQPGDRVMGFSDYGVRSHAEYLVISAKQPIIKIPGQLDFQTAVATIEGAHYAYNSILKVDLKPRQRVMLNGATGAIGSALLQQLKHFGAYVTATCNTRNVERIDKLGPDRLINYELEDFTRDAERYDYVIDAVGKSTFGKCKRLLKKNGVYISSELGPYAQNIPLSLLGLLKVGKHVRFPIPFQIERSLKFNSELAANGEFKPLIDRVYPLDKISEAFAYVLTGEKTGNVIIKMHDK